MFKKVQNMLGGRVRFIISGSAPISVRVLDFLRAAFGCTVSQDEDPSHLHNILFPSGDGGVWTD